MDPKTLIIMVIAVFSSIIGLIYWVIRSRDRLVYRDVCESERKRLEDCIEGSLKLMQMQYKNLCNRFDELKELIKNDRG